jgi:hypothetical protein
MRAFFAVSLTLTLLAAASSLHAQSEDAPLPPPPPPPPDAVLPNERPTAPAPTPAPAPAPTPTPAPAPTLAPAPAPAPTPSPDSPSSPALTTLPPPPPSPPGADATQPPAPVPTPAEAPDEPKPVKKKKRYWYGWQIIIMDGSALLLFTSGAGLYLLAVPVYVLGGPLVHASHKQGIKGAISLGLRIGAPLIAGTVSARTKPCNLGRPDECTRGLHPATLLAALGVSVFDMAYLAREPTEPRPAGSRGRTFSVSPAVTLDRDGGQAFLTGSF